MHLQTLDWLLEENNPGVRVRALTGLCGLPDTDEQVIAARAQTARTLDAARDLAWMEDSGIKLIYNLTAIAECGLTRADSPVDPVVDRLLAGTFDANCGDFMLLRALVMLGYGDDPRVQLRLAMAIETQMPDGGWFCLHRLKNAKQTPKSCMKAAMHALLLLGEMHKRGLSFVGQEALTHYFLKRRLFYRTDNPTQLVTYGRPGYRMIDAFFPNELMRVGLPVLLEALSALGLGKRPEMQEAWGLLECKLDALGRLKLEGTLNKPYLPKERVGQLGKWVTLYAALALQGRDTRPGNRPS